MRLSLICHASTSAMRRAAFPLDEPIDTAGTAKAAALAGLLPLFAQAWTGTALRTVQTAAALQLDARPANSLDDCCYGRWAGRRLMDLQHEESAEVSTWLQDPMSSPHGGESLHALQQRVAYWMDGLDKHAEHSIAVSHPAVIRSAILHALGASLESFWRIDINPLSITDLRFNGRNWTVRAMGVDANVQPKFDDLSGSLSVQE